MERAVVLQVEGLLLLLLLSSLLLLETSCMYVCTEMPGQWKSVFEKCIVPNLLGKKIILIFMVISFFSDAF